MNRAQNVKDVEHKTTKKTNEESALNTKKADLEGTQKELDAALASKAVKINDGTCVSFAKFSRSFREVFARFSRFS